MLEHFCALEGFWPSGPHCPIVFCDIVGKEEGTSSHHKAHQESKCNRVEADKIVINSPHDDYQLLAQHSFTGGYYYSNK